MKYADFTVAILLGDGSQLVTKLNSLPFNLMEEFAGSYQNLTIILCEIGTHTNSKLCHKFAKILPPNSKYPYVIQIKTAAS